MAAVGPTRVYNLSNAIGMGGPAPFRLGGSLAAGALATGNTYTERVKVQGALSITLRTKSSAVSGSPTIQAIPLLADASDDSTGSGTVLAGTQVATGLTPRLLA